MACNSQEITLVPVPKTVQYTNDSLKVSGANAKPQVRIDPCVVLISQGYRLTIDHSGVSIVAHDDAGAYYARQTLAQIVLQNKDAGALPCLQIEDNPDFPVRGVMLDISRDKVPTMQTLFELIDHLASWKINHLQLYTEHTFAYTRHEKVWGESSPITAAEVRELDVYCKERFIELVPNQNSFGHMHRWLKHDEYKHLAECPDGWETPWNERRTEPFSLCPVEPASISFLEGLYDELLPNFSSRYFNVGLDETYEVGQGKSKQACDELGTGRVYLDFLKKVHALVQQREHTMMFWGDIILQHPELVAELPRDAIVLEWGYEADHDFDGRCAKFAASGLSFYVCPGTSSWNTAIGRTDNAIENIRAAALAGRKHGATGLLNTDWGDNGHTQPLILAYPGLIYGAAVGWSIDSHDSIDLPKAMDLFVFEDGAGIVGQTIYDLGNAYKLTGLEELHNATLMFEAIFRIERAKDQSPFQGLNADRLRETQAYINDVMASFSKAEMACPDANQVQEDLLLAVDIARHGLDLAIALTESDGDSVRGLSSELREQLRDRLTSLRKRYRNAWRNRNRPGGLNDSLRLFQRALSCYGYDSSRVTIDTGAVFQRPGVKDRSISPIGSD